MTHDGAVRRRLFISAQRRRWIHGCSLVAAVLLLSTACGPGRMVTEVRRDAASHLPSKAKETANPWFGRRVVAVTHNGGQFEFPQDTLFALRRAQDLHMQVLDVDIQLSKDNVPVLIHSANLASSTNGHGNVSSRTAAQLARLDAAYQWIPGCGTCSGRPASAYPDRGVRTGAAPLPAGATTRSEFGVPTLQQVFRQFPNAYLDVELKPQSDAAPQVATLIHQFHREARTIVASFDDKQIAQFHALAPTVAISPGQQASQAFFLGMPLPSGFQVLQLPYRYDVGGRDVTVITPSLVKRAHTAGVALWVWDEGATPGTALYSTLVRLGVDGILASSPSDLLQVLRADHQEWSGDHGS